MKRVLLSLFLVVLLSVQAQDTKVSLYGFVRNDFFYNSRVNVESFDGIFNILPRPIEMINGKDKNEQAQAEMLSIITRLGLNITGPDLLGAKSSAKIETDFAGYGATFFLLRLRQAYTQLNWERSELLLGQTWHPMFGNVVPTVAAVNVGAPFQPFNRSPQLRYKQYLADDFSFTLAAIYQMQYVSQGPLGNSNSYLKNNLLPSFFAGFEHKNAAWINGVGVDFKTIVPALTTVSSTSFVAYSQFQTDGFIAKAKAVYGQNLSDLIMLGGYGLSVDGEKSYTSLNTFSSWVNVLFGKKFQYGIFAGYMQNLGTHTDFKLNNEGKYEVYGYGYFANSKTLVDRLVRVAPTCSYTVKNLKFGLEYDFTRAKFGTVKSNGRVDEAYNVNNHRIVAFTSYTF